MDNQDLLLIEMMIKLASIHKLLVNKNILTDVEIQNEMMDISKNLAEQVNNNVLSLTNNIIKN